MLQFTSHYNIAPRAGASQGRPLFADFVAAIRPCHGRRGGSRLRLATQGRAWSSIPPSADDYERNAGDLPVMVSVEALCALTLRQGPYRSLSPAGRMVRKTVRPPLTGAVVDRCGTQPSSKRRTRSLLHLGGSWSVAQHSLRSRPRFNRARRLKGAKPSVRYAIQRLEYTMRDRSCPLGHSVGKHLRAGRSPSRSLY